MNNDKAQISMELSRLIARQTEFFQRLIQPPTELQEFERTRKCIRILLAELAQSNKAA